MVTPTNSAQVRNSDQPVTLAVQNAVSTKPGVTYTFTPPTNLAPNTTLFWRATAIDALNGVTSAPSAALSFTTAFAIDLSKVVFLHSPDVSNWPQTGTLILVEQDGAAPGPMCMTFTDPGWPDSHWPFPGPDPNFGV